MAILKTSKGQEFQVSEEDYGWVSRYKWRVDSTGYAKRNLKTRYGKRISNHTLYLHREILKRNGGLVESIECDHANRDKLDNRRCNLRASTRQQNERNCTKRNGCFSSKFKGVSWANQKKRWRCRTCVDGKDVWLGYFFDEEQAARAYDAFAREHYGEFAYLNFPDLAR
jgi:hypothetical protein